MKKGGLLISVLCLFLVACSPKSQLLPEETNAISPHLEVVIEDELSGSSPPDYQVILEENNVPPPLYTISSVPPLDDEDALLTYFVGNDITSAFFYSEDEEVDTGALIAWFLQGYGFPTTTIGSYYLLTRTGDTQWSEKINQIGPEFTNDPNREIQSIPFEKIDKNTAKYHCFYCEIDWDATTWNGEDEKYLFIDMMGRFGIPKSTLPNYIPLQTLGIQSVDLLVGYTKGYLVLFPFKFPVDAETFQTVQGKIQLQWGKRDDIPSLKELAGEWRRPRFQNADVIYDKYLGDDKDWVYFWSRTSGKGYRINRIPKSSDFKLLGPTGKGNVNSFV